MCSELPLGLNRLLLVHELTEVLLKKLERVGLFKKREFISVEFKLLELSERIFYSISLNFF